MEELTSYVERVENFDTLSASDKIEFFAYYLLYIHKNIGFTARQIKDCYDELKIKAYSNIPSFLTTKSKGRNHIFLKIKNGFTLERKEKERIEKIIGVHKVKPLTDDYFPYSLLNNTRGYLEKIASQAIGCYDHNLFDACLVMTRKLIETLIIELYERRKIEHKIKNINGHYLYLSDLISYLLAEPSWAISRNAQQGFSPIKKLADVSAHNRRFSASKSDIDKLKSDIRLIVEELIHLIDYNNWK